MYVCMYDSDSKFFMCDGTGSTGFKGKILSTFRKCDCCNVNVEYKCI